MPDILISKKSEKLIRSGFPWIYKDDIVNNNSSLEIAEPGELCGISDEKGKKIALGYFNPKTNISARILSFDTKQKVDKEFFKEKISKAIERRKKYFPHIRHCEEASPTRQSRKGDIGTTESPRFARDDEERYYFRAVYGESDGLPGLIIDIYGEYGVAQVNSAGMELLQEHWLPALLELVNLKGVYLDGSSKHRIREGLKINSGVIYGDIPEIIPVIENNFTYYADIINGQKTGWFYDQRDNRKYLASLAKGKNALDIYTHSGGFGLLCAKEGATSVELADRSELGLSLAEKAASSIKDKIKFTKAEAFELLDEYKQQNKKFDIVNADPPAFIKNKKDIEAGLKGYEKLTRKCLALVADNGIFAISSCSYFARPEAFQKTIENALKKYGRKFELLRKSGADKDHPVHPMLAETNYLKFLVYRLDN